MSSPDLFRDADPPESRGGGAPPLFLVTNQVNLTHFLARGYIGPRESFGTEDNYWEDLLDAAPGRLPLLTAPIDRRVVDQVLRESPQAIPVLLEVDPSYLALGNAPALDPEGNPVSAPATGFDILATAVPAVLPFRAVTRIAFLGEEDKEEVLVREDLWEGVPSIPGELVDVAPDLVGMSPLGLEAILSWLGDLDVPDGPTELDFTRTDRIMGAVALAAHARPDLKPALVDLYKTGEPKPPLPAWLGHLVAEDPLEATDHDPDAITFAAAVTALRGTPHNTWIPGEVLEGVWARVGKGNVPGEEVERLGKGVDRIRRVLDAEEAFEPSKSQAYPGLQGLMLVLIRRDPEALLSWTEEETNAGPLAHLTAALYAGLLRGHERLSLSFRGADLDRELAEVAAWRLSNAFPPGPERPRRPSRPTETTDGLKSLLADAPLDSDGPNRRAALALCRELDWRDCVTSFLICPNDDPVTMDYVVRKRKVVRFSVAGFAELEYGLDVEAFRARLRDADIPKGVTRTVRALLD